ncbi:MAG: ABC transporter ATP-binding protein [Proteobacteria bacterium]|nr:ABC transporter ATP-binding protein [Pseudomonadota bacterium]
MNASTPIDKPQSTIETIGHKFTSLWRIGAAYAIPQWKWYLSGIIALVITNIIMLEIPQLAKSIINALSAGEALETFSSTAYTIIALGFLLVVIRTTSRVFIFWPGRTLEAAVKDDLFSHILSIPAKFLANFGLGDLTSRLSNDVTQLRVFFAFGALQVLNVLLMMSFTIVKMASINLVLTVLTVIPLIVMLVLTRIVMPKLYLATKEATEATGRLTNRVTEAFVNVNIIQSSVAIDPFVDRSAIESKSIYDANMRTVKIRNLIFPLMIIMAGISEFAILSWGGLEVIDGKLSVGDLMAFNIYVGILIFPFTSIGLILAIYQRAKPAAERLRDIALMPSESDQTRGADIHSSDSKIPLIRIENLNFSYQSSESILSHITAVIYPRQKIGIYGAIGSGKSTLFSLLTRLYDPPRGSIFVRGIDVLDIPPEDLRNTIGFAPQTPLLFSESIFDNLQLGFDEPISQQRLNEAAEKAEILSEIERFPQKWDTVVGENGVRLSGGQKQRLALARLLLRTSQVYILDDVLSAVDHTTERNLIKSLLETKATLIIASHRTSILEDCDEVWILEEGRIAHRGTFQELSPLIHSMSKNIDVQDSGVTP